MVQLGRGGGGGGLGLKAAIRKLSSGVGQRYGSFGGGGGGADGGAADFRRQVGGHNGILFVHSYSRVGGLAVFRRRTCFSSSHLSVLKSPRSKCARQNSTSNGGGRGAGTTAF